jgi:hypothetical protein
MYDPYIGPSIRPRVVELFQTNIIHTRCVLAYISSMLPAITTDGTEEAKPDMNRPMKTPATEGTTPVIRLPMLKAAHE